MNNEALRTLSSVLIILVGAMLGWSALSRATSRSQRKYEDLLDLAARPGASDGALMAAQRKLTALRLVANGARYGIVLVALLLILDQLDVRVTGLLLPAGFAGAALGVGAQNVVRDVLAGLFLLFESQFAVGDAVSINGVAGTVEEVGVRVTRLRDASGQEHFFPNGAITTVARYPRRSVPLLLRLPLLELDRQDDLEAAIQAAHRDFAALFDRAATPPERLLLPDPVPQSEPTLQVLEATSPAQSAESTEYAAEVAAAPSALDFAWWRWEASPARAALWREKFAPQAMAQLRRADLQSLAGEAEVLNAPADA